VLASKASTVYIRVIELDHVQTSPGWQRVSTATSSGTFGAGAYSQQYIPRGPSTTPFLRVFMGFAEMTGAVVQMVAACVLFNAALKALKSQSAARRIYIHWLFLKVPLTLAMTLPWFIRFHDRSSSPGFANPLAEPWLIAATQAGSLMMMGLVLPLTTVIVINLREVTDWVALRSEQERERSE
jgi:hypothetical protein